jgi:hypothetical protein
MEFTSVVAGLGQDRDRARLRLPMTPFAKTLQKDSHVRRYEILPDVNGWRVLEREDSRVIRDAVYSDWHRVERARRAFVVEMTSLRNEGWTDSRP